VAGQRRVRLGRRPGNRDTRGEIVAAARRAFAEGGFGGISLRGIATEAGVDVALIYHYFHSKEELFLATMQIPVPSTSWSLHWVVPREPMASVNVWCARCWPSGNLIYRPRLWPRSAQRSPDRGPATQRSRSWMPNTAVHSSTDRQSQFPAEHRPRQQRDRRSQHRPVAAEPCRDVSRKCSV
jgi:hypothetical protein